MRTRKSRRTTTSRRYYKIGSRIGTEELMYIGSPGVDTYDSKTHRTKSYNLSDEDGAIYIKIKGKKYFVEEPDETKGEGQGW